MIIIKEKVMEGYPDDSVKKQVSVPINIILDGPPGPEGGRFVEVETDDGKSISVGQWIERDDGLWSLRIAQLPHDKGD